MRITISDCSAAPESTYAGDGGSGGLFLAVKGLPAHSPHPLHHDTLGIWWRPPARRTP